MRKIVLVLFPLFFFWKIGVVYAESLATVKAIYTSSQLNSVEWNVNHLIDGDSATSWSSRQLPTADIQNTPEWLSFDFGTPTPLAKIILTPRVWNNQIQAFPRNFNLSYSDDGTTWKILPGGEFYDYPTPGINSDGTAQNQSFPVNQVHRFFGLGFTKASTDSYGGYFVQLADVKFVENQCQSNSECSNGQSCQQGACGIDTLPYWNLKPGSYWILRGSDRYGGSPLSFRQRYDLELPESICTDGASKDVLTWRITRDVACPSPHQCYWGNLRFMFANPTTDTSPYVWATADKRYDRNSANPFADIGSLYQHSFYSGWQDATHPYIPPYLYTPKFLPDAGENLEYRYRQNYFWNNGQPGTPIADGNMCQASNLAHDQADLIMRYSLTNINTPAYSGPALLVSQGEKSGWCTREDWYLAPNIGIARVDQWNCNTTGAACYDGQNFGNCTCNSWTSDPGNHPNCYQNKALVNPAMSMSLEKYYLGHALQVSVNNVTTIAVNKGQTLTLSFLDPSTNFTYEGQVETDGNFLSLDGNSVVPAGQWNTWIGPDGKVNLTVGQSLQPGTYVTRFRPHVFGPPASAISTNAEAATSENDLPWSNQITVTVNTLPGDLNGDGHVDILDLRQLLSNFTGIFDYNLVVGNFGK